MSDVKRKLINLNQNISKNYGEINRLACAIADLTHTVKNHGAQLDTAVQGVNSQMRLFGDIFKQFLESLTVKREADTEEQPKKDPGYPLVVPLPLPPPVPRFYDHQRSYNPKDMRDSARDSRQQNYHGF